MSSTIYHVYKFGCYASALIGAALADSFVGKYRSDIGNRDEALISVLQNYSLHWHSIRHRARNSSFWSRREWPRGDRRISQHVRILLVKDDVI